MLRSTLLFIHHSSLPHSSFPLRLSFEDSAEAVGVAVVIAAHACAARAVGDYADASRFAAVVVPVVCANRLIVSVVAVLSTCFTPRLFVAPVLLAVLRVDYSVAALGDVA